MLGEIADRGTPRCARAASRRRGDADGADQRSGARLPARDGAGVAAHARGRGRDRQAHRGGRARAERAVLGTPFGVREVLATRGAAAQRQHRAARGGRRARRSRAAARRHEERRKDFLLKTAQDPAARRARSPRSSPRSRTRAPATTRASGCAPRSTRSTARSSELLRETRFSKSRIEEIRQELGGRGRASCAGTPPRARKLVTPLGAVARRVPRAGGALAAPQPARARTRSSGSAAIPSAWSQTRRALDEIERCVQRIEADSAHDARRDPQRGRDARRGLRAHAARQERAGRGQPAPRGLDREEVHEPRAAVPRPDPGGQHRPDEGRGQVRVPARLQVLDLRHLVDPPGDHARDRRSGAHHPHPRAHDRDDQQAGARAALPGADARPRADARGALREDGAAGRQGAHGAQDREGADQPRDAGRRGGGQPPRRLHRGQERRSRRRSTRSTPAWPRTRARCSRRSRRARSRC